MTTFTEIYYNGNEYKQMWLNGSKVWQKLEDGDVPLPSDDQYVGYDLVLYVSGSNTSYGDAFYRATFPNKLDESLEYIDSFTYGAFSGRDYESIAKLKNVKYYGKTETKIDGVGSLSSPNYKILKVSAPISATDLSYLCYNISDDTDLRFLRTKNATNMEHMFEYASVTSLDLTAFKTNNVTNMDSMFASCSSLTSLDLSSFNTSNVKYMASMFYNCNKLTSLDLSNFDTSKVTNMSFMFFNCSSLKSLDVSNWDTSSVTDMGFMFANCPSLTSLDLSNFDTSKVTNMNNMFVGCWSLTSLDLSNFDTSSVTDTNNMFQYVSNCTIYIGENWSLDTSSSAYGGSNLTFIRVVPITSITLESTLTDTTITKGTQFTITPTITPTDYSGDELIITYDENYLSMVDNTFTVLDTATIGQQLDITYSSKNNPSVSATYSVSIRDSISITSIVLTHTLETLTDVAIGTTFTVVPTVEPTVYDDELLVDYDTSYLSKDGDSYTVLEGASGQIVQIIYYSKHNNNVNAMLEFTVEEKAEPIVIDLQSTAPKLPDYLTLDYNSTYYFKNGSYGLYPSAPPGDEKSKLNYSRYKLIAPRNGVLKFTYRYYSNASYYFSINVNEDDTCPSYTSGNAVLENNRNYDNTRTSSGLEIIGGITYYIHLQLKTPSVYSSGSVQIKTITIE